MRCRWAGSDDALLRGKGQVARSNGHGRVSRQKTCVVKGCGVPSLLCDDESRVSSVTWNTQGRDHAFLTLVLEGAASANGITRTPKVLAEGAAPATAAAVLQSCSPHVLSIGRGAQCVVVSLKIVRQQMGINAAPIWRAR